MSFQIDLSSGLIILPTKITGLKSQVLINLAVDTGASKTMINWDILVLIGYDPAIVKERIQMTTGSSIEYVPIIEVDEIEAIGIIKKGMLVLCHTLPPSATVDGVLGLDFFRGYKLAIDFNKGIIDIDQ